jgi:hypothetical protein
MTALIAFLLAAAPAPAQQPQQPTPPARRSATPPNAVPRPPVQMPPGGVNGSLQSPRLVTPFDTTMEAVTQVSRAVAEVRAEVDRFRMVAYNDPNGSLFESAAAFRTRCEDLAKSAEKAPATMCRRCMAAQAQAAVDAFRAYLPRVTALGNRCAATLRRARGTREDSTSAAALRRQARPLSEVITTGLQGYETRMTEVRRVFGAQQTPIGPTPRRPR